MPATPDSQEEQVPCPVCGALNPLGTQRCAKCETTLIHSTLSLTRAEIDERNPTFRIAPDQGNPYTVQLVKPLLNIGSSSTQEIQLKGSGIAAYHARIKQEGILYRLYNLTTPRGVLVNEAEVQASQVLHDGDKLRLQDAEGQGVSITYSNPVERALAPKSDGATYSLERLPFIVGRDPAADLNLDSLAVSWRHAKISEQGGHVLEDLGSANGTFVNDRPIKGSYRLRQGDSIRIDQTLLVYMGKSLKRLAALQKYQLDAVDLEMTYRTGLPRKTLNTMRQVSLSIHPQEFVAIIGGSGSGKSTLLRALNGVNRATNGKVLVNGDDLYSHYEMYQPVIGYVPQSDIVHDDLTVYQSLWFGARLRFPNEQAVPRRQRIARVLDDLELKDFENRLVRNLSGGQKKRVSIAQELMAEPGLLFMDEPSSGLDPGLDKSMMGTLRQLADRGHIVVVVTHTTLNISLCDQLALMARGNLAFFGPPKDALTLFDVKDYPDIYNRVLESPDVIQSTNPNQTFMYRSGSVPARGDGQGEAISPGEAGQRWAEYYRTTLGYLNFVLKRFKPIVPSAEHADAANSAETLSHKRLQGTRRGTFLQQTRVLTERTLALARRDARTIIMLLFVLPLVGLFLASISYDRILNKPGQILVKLDNIDKSTLLEKLPTAPLDCSTQPATPPELSKCPPIPSRSTRFKSYFNQVGTYAPASEAQRLLFMMALAVTLLGIFASAYTIVAEKSLFLRERMVNLRIAPYLASKLVVYGGLAMVSCLLLLIIVSFGVHLPSQGVITWGPLELFISLSLTAIAGVTIGLLLSSLGRQVNVVTYAVLGVLFIQILFPGVLFKMSGALQPFSMLTVTRWSLESLGATANLPARDAESEIVVRTKIFNVDTQTELPEGIQLFPAPPSISLNYPTTADGLWVRWGVMIGFSALFLVLAGLALNRSESF